MKFIDIHTHKNYSLDYGICIKNVFPNENLEEEGFSSIGLHPWYIEKDTYKQQLKQVRDFAAQKEVMAIGETGLDTLTDTPFDIQLEVFENHIQIAELVKKPLIIHCVKANNELIEVKRKTNPKQPWIVHGFNSKFQVAEMLLKQNIYLSFGKAILYPLSNAAQVLDKIPEDRFFLETDDSEFNIDEIYKIASEIKKVKIENLKSIVSQNFKNCFGIENG